MAQRWRSRGWRLGLANYLAVAGALGQLSIGVIFSENYAFAQIKPDATLGTERSVVTSLDPDFPAELIDGGAKRGANLFHSFREFNIDEGRGAYFTNPSGIKNILSRVTGKNRSDIQGTLGVLGQANLFLINPNGIIFGPKSSLDVKGSFVATTANAIQFDQQGFFSTSEPNAPPLLTVNPSAFLFNQIAHGSIENNSIAPAGVDPSGMLNAYGLRVPDGQSLLLLGGDITMNTGGLYAFGGRVELGGVTGVGTVGLEIDSNTFSLSLPYDSLLSDVTLADNALVSVPGAGGNIVVNADTFTATNGGRLVAGAQGVGDGGDITINANNVNISGVGSSGLRSGLYNQTPANTSGSSGNVFVNTKFFNAASGAQVASFTLGQGDAGNVIINASDTVSFDGLGTRASSFVGKGAVGNGGDVNIMTGSLSVKDSAFLSTGIDGQGDAGNVIINASDTVSFDGVESGAYSAVSEGAVGNGGDVNITAGSMSLTKGALLAASIFGQGTGGDINIMTGSLSVKDGSLLNTLIFGQGDAGNVIINASDTVSFDGVESGAYSFVSEGAVGNGGDVNITAGSMSLTKGALLGAPIIGQGTSGDINITTGSLSIKDGASLSTNTYGQGDAGSVTIQAQDTVSVSGINSGITTTVAPSAIGNGGNINIMADSLFLTDNAQLNTTTFGQGNAGNIQVNASDSISVTGGSLLAATTSGPGNGGKITIDAPSAIVSFDGYKVFDDGSLSYSIAITSVAPTQGFVPTGQGGDITIKARSLSVTNGATLLTATFGKAGANGLANAGNIFVNAADFVAVSGGSQLNTATLGEGNAGNVTIDSPDAIVSFDGVGDLNIPFATGKIVPTPASSGIFTVVDRLPGFKDDRQGGNITIKAKSLFLTNSSILNASNIGNGTAGNLDIEAGSIRLDNKAVLSSETTSGQGNIILNSDDLVLRRGSNITTDAKGTATGGNITIDTNFLVAAENSDIRANATEGLGGQVTIDAQGIFGTEFREAKTPQSDITATSELGPQFSGTVDVNTPDVDPSQGLVALPEEVVDASGLIAQGCVADEGPAASRFTVTGRGGLPPNPDETPSADDVLAGLVTLDPKAEPGSGTVNSKPLPKNTPTVLKEARGWVINDKGEVTLTAQAPPSGACD